jgi:hypothetical protein
MGTTSCIGGDPGANANECMHDNELFLVSWGGGGGRQGRKRGVNVQTDLRTTNCHKDTILRTATKAPFGALVGDASLTQPLDCRVTSK